MQTSLEQSGGEDAANHADDDDAGTLEQSGIDAAANHADDDDGDALELSGGEDASNRADEDDSGALEQSGGEDAANHADDNDAGAGGEDHLSALPDDVLLLILLRLNSTSDAARTGVLSRRWRHVWTLLPVLQFGPSIDPHTLRGVLSANELPLLRTLLFVQRDASPQSPAAWLPDAARRLSGDLTLINFTDRKADSEAEASQRGTFELPCFQKATSICLLGCLNLSVSPAGVFARLTELNLGDVRFYGPGELGDAVSSPRCPCLQKLCIINVKGLDNISINSRSLQLLNLQIIPGLRQITVVAPALRDFILVGCFSFDKNQPVVNISVPRLKSLNWCDSYDQSSVDLGSMKHLQKLETSFVVYGIDSFTDNSACLVLLPRFQVIRNLILSLIYPREIHHLQYMMEGMTKLPDVTSLQLTVKAEGHSFGASLFHVLKFCSGIKLLILVLCQPLLLKVPSACSSGCVCDQQTNWKTDDISLNLLQELEIKGFRALEHDVAFVKRLLNWVPVLKIMTVTSDCSITENKAKELVQMFQGLSRPGVCMKFHISQNIENILFAPND